MLELNYFNWKVTKHFPCNQAIVDDIIFTIPCNQEYQALIADDMGVSIDNHVVFEIENNTTGKKLYLHFYCDFLTIGETVKSAY